MKWSILWFFGSYGLFYVIALAYRLVFDEVSIPFWIAEKNAEVVITMHLAEIFDLILLGFIFSINAFHAFEIFESRTTRKKRSRVYFMIGIIILNAGVWIHMVTNQLHEYIYKMEEAGTIIEAGSHLEELALGLYFWDEVVSHLLTAFGFFFLVYLYCQLEMRNENTIEFNETYLKLICMAVGMGMSFGLIEGQAAAAFFFVSLFMLAVISLEVVFKKKKWKLNPFTTATIYFLIGYIIFTLAYVYLTGMKPNYPYIYQMSEL